VTDHLIQKGAKRIAFFARAHSAQTVNHRIVGYREALYTHGLPISKDLVIWGDPTDAELVESVLRTRADAIMCANDETAANLMKTLIGLGVRIPEDVRLAGIDDVRYASLLPIPLTTLHQPCEQIGSAGISAMLERVNQPHLPPRSILLDGHLVVRSSCGNGIQSLSQDGASTKR
jgi:DNA-binding LacI/PurR family transcriptional regulator